MPNESAKRKSGKIPNHPSITIPKSRGSRGKNEVSMKKKASRGTNTGTTSASSHTPLLPEKEAAKEGRACKPDAS